MADENNTNTEFDYESIDFNKSKIDIKDDKSLILTVEDKDGNKLKFTALSEEDKGIAKENGEKDYIRHTIYDDNFPKQYSVEINEEKAVFAVSDISNTPLEDKALETIKKEIRKKLIEELLEKEIHKKDIEKGKESEETRFLKKMGKADKDTFDEIYEFLKKKKVDDISLSDEDKEKELKALEKAHNEYTGFKVNTGQERVPPASNTNEDAPEDADWIKRKIENYQKMANGKIEGCPKLESYEHDENIKDGFAAYFNGGHIHYSSSDSVTVSKESGLKVFEVLVSEPDNKGRPVNFGSNLDHEQAVKLFAACLLHDNPIGENAPQLSEADLKLIEDELKDRPDDLAAFKEKAQAYTQSQQQNTAANEGEQPQPIEKAFDDETKKQIKEALNNQYEMAAMESSGKIDENKEKYNELKAKQIDDKKFLAEKFVKNPRGMRAIINDMIKEKTNGHTKKSELTDQEKTDLATVRQTQISALRDKMAKTADGNSDQLMEHDKKILALSGRLNEGDKAFVTKKDGKQEVKALEGKAKERFEASNKDAIARALENYKSITK